MCIRDSPNTDCSVQRGDNPQEAQVIEAAHQIVEKLTDQVGTAFGLLATRFCEEFSYGTKKKKGQLSEEESDHDPPPARLRLGTKTTVTGSRPLGISRPAAKPKPKAKASGVKPVGSPEDFVPIPNPSPNRTRPIRSKGKSVPDSPNYSTDDEQGDTIAQEPASSSGKGNQPDISDDIFGDAPLPPPDQALGKSNKDKKKGAAKSAPPDGDPDDEPIVEARHKRIHDKLQSEAELWKLHILHNHMSLPNFKARTSKLEIPKKIYDMYDRVCKSCDSCGKYAPAPERSRVSGWRAYFFGDIWFLSLIHI